MTHGGGRASKRRFVRTVLLYPCLPLFMCCTSAPVAPTGEVSPFSLVSPCPSVSISQLLVAKPGPCLTSKHNLPHFSVILVRAAICFPDNPSQQQTLHVRACLTLVGMLEHIETGWKAPTLLSLKNAPTLLSLKNAVRVLETNFSDLASAVCMKCGRSRNPAGQHLFL